LNKGSKGGLAPPHFPLLLGIELPLGGNSIDTHHLVDHLSSVILKMEVIEYADRRKSSKDRRNC
jgi:hypothetical protein